MPVVFGEWLNTNEQRNYPIHDEATLLSVAGGKLPNSFLVDANIWLPDTLGSYVYVSSAGVTDGVVSLTLLAATYNPICGSGSDTFRPVAAVTISKPVVRFKNYPIQPFVQGVGGWVAFGEAAISGDNFSLLFDTPSATLLVDRVVRAYRVTPVTNIGKVNITPPLDGLIHLKGAVGLVRTFGATKSINGTDTLVGMVGLDLTSNALKQLKEFTGTCGGRPAAGTCKVRPINTVNGVVPDSDGNIDIMFTGDESIGDTGDGMVIDHPTGLGELCPKEKFNELVNDQGDVCSSSSSSSSSISSSSSSSSSDFPTSSSSSGAPLPLDGASCEDFEDNDLDEIASIKGTWAIVDGVNGQLGNNGDEGLGYSHGKILKADPYASDGERYCLNVGRLMSINTGYTISGVLSPTDEAHLIFGYANANDFFVLGVATNLPDYPYGAIFIAKRKPVSATDGVVDHSIDGSKYLIMPGLVREFVSSEALLNNQYKVSAAVSLSGGFVIVNTTVDYAAWSSTAEGYVLAHETHSFSIPYSAGFWENDNTIAYVGFGSLSLTCEVDNFCINSSVTPPAAPSCCETFTGGVGGMVAKIGSAMTAGTGRLHTSSAHEATQLSVNGSCKYDITEPGSVYRVKAVVNPGTGGAEAGLVFGFQEVDEYWSFVVVAQPRVGNQNEMQVGQFILEQKFVSSGGNAQTIRTIDSFPDGATALPAADYTMEAFIHNVGRASILQEFQGILSIRVTWNDGTNRVHWLYKQLIINDTSGSIVMKPVGYIGLISRTSESSFDNLCSDGAMPAVDCGMSPPGSVQTLTFDNAYFASYGYGRVPAWPHDNYGGGNSAPTGGGGTCPDTMPPNPTILSLDITRSHYTLLAGLAGTIDGNLSVKLKDFAHDQIGDLHCVLVSPSGVAVTVFYRPGSTSCAAGNPYYASLGDYQFAEAGSALATAGVVSPGSYGRSPGDWPGNPAIPIGAFTDFDGECIEGKWRLFIYDWESGGSGRISNFEITADIV